MRSSVTYLLEFLSCTSGNQIMPGVLFHSGPEKLVVMFVSHHIDPTAFGYH